MRKIINLTIYIAGSQKKKKKTIYIAQSSKMRKKSYIETVTFLVTTKQ